MDASGIFTHGWRPICRSIGLCGTLLGVWGLREMRNYPKGTYPRTGNGVITTRFKVIKRDITETDMRSISPLSKMTPPLETSISFQEAGTLAAKKPAMKILTLTITRQVRILFTHIHSHQEGSRYRWRGWYLCTKNRCQTRRSQSIISWRSAQPKPSRKKRAIVGRIIDWRRETGVGWICIPCRLWWGGASLRKAVFLDAECRERMLVCITYMHACRSSYTWWIHQALSWEPSDSWGVPAESMFGGFHSSFRVGDSMDSIGARYAHCPGTDEMKHSEPQRTKVEGRPPSNFGRNERVETAR